MIPPIDLEQAKERTVDEINRWVDLKKRGLLWYGLCPFHPDKHPSFTVNERKRLWRCWPCGFGGDVFDFIQKFHSVDFLGACEILGLKRKETSQDREIWQRAQKSFAELERDKQALLADLTRQYSELCGFSRIVNGLINSTPPIEREAWLYSNDLWLHAELDAILAEIDEVHKIAARHRREILQWMEQQQNVA